jgi:hypothetical protein
MKTPKNEKNSRLNSSKSTVVLGSVVTSIDWFNKAETAKTE